MGYGTDETDGNGSYATDGKNGGEGSQYGDALGKGGVGPVAQRLVATGRVGFSGKG